MSAEPAAPRQPWEEDVIFVTGYGRTGTTLMQGLLCASEDVMGVTTEAKILRSFIETYAVGLAGWKAYTSDYFADEAAYRSFMRQVLGFYLQHVRTRFATDKRLLQKVPQRAAAHVSEVASLLPNAQFIVMVRDPRAALASQAEFNQHYGRRLNLAREIGGFVELYSSLVARLPSMSGRLMLVRYEHLVTSAVATMTQVAEFLSIRMPANLESLEWESKRTKALAEASPLDGRAVSAASLTKYRQTLPSRVLDRLEHERQAIERRIGMSVFYDEGSPNGPAVLL